MAGFYPARVRWSQIATTFAAVRALMGPPDASERGRIGF
jgi:hypothetical protein